ncbi:MAG TPA: F0F1 ATP synthase subunit B [Mycobacteriales bacterium]|nr:F0F1 ATP synthase subunit B [Mycobacteriales bacterium]
MLLYLAAESGTPVEESGPNPVIPAAGELVIGLITFAIVVYVLARYAWPRMEATFQARRDAIEGGIRRAEEAQEEARRLLTEYRQQLAEARTEAAQIRDNARAEGQRIIEDMRVTAQEESARIVARGEEQLTVQRQQVVRDLRGEIGTLAVQLAERVVGETLSEDAARQRSVNRFLDDLDDMAQSVPAGAVSAPAAGSGGGGGPGGGGPAGGGPAGGGPAGGGPAGGGAGPAGGSGSGGATRATGAAGDGGTGGAAGPGGPAVDGGGGAGPVGPGPRGGR